MAATENYEVVGSYNDQRVNEIDSERTVNCFEYIDPLGKKPRTLINTSGLIDTEYDYGATFSFRAQYAFNEFEYSVVGNRVYRRDTNNVVTQLNNSLLLTTTEGYVGIDANTFQVIIVDGSRGYIYDTIANTFAQIVDASFPSSPIDVCTLDGFFVVAQGNTPNFFLSSFNQGMVWGPAQNSYTTNFAVNSNLAIGASTIGGVSGTQNYQTGIPVQVTNSGGSPPGPLALNKTYYVIRINATNIRLATTYANAIAGNFITLVNDGTGTQTIVSLGQEQRGQITTHPGNIIACRTLHRRLFLFSNFYYEVWENAGIGTNLPFRRNNSLLGEYGTTSASCIATGFDYMFFISQDRDSLGPVMQIAGTSPIPISNRALDFQLAQYAATTGIEDCRSFLIKEDGLFFLRMNFTSSNHTFVYNVSLSDPSQEQTKLWHEEEVLNGDRHPAQTHAYFNGSNYVGSYDSSTLYEVRSDIYTNGALVDPTDGRLRQQGEVIRRMRITRPIVTPGYQRRRIDRLQFDLLQGSSQSLQLIEIEVNLDAENGLNLLTESGINLVLEGDMLIENPITPTLYLSISKDGGQTWGYLLQAPMGTAGQTTYRTVYRKLGVIPRGQGFVCKVEFFDPMPFVLLGGAWAYEILPE